LNTITITPNNDVTGNLYTAPKLPVPYSILDTIKLSLDLPGILLQIPFPTLKSAHDGNSLLLNLSATTEGSNGGTARFHKGGERGGYDVGKIVSVKCVGRRGGMIEVRQSKERSDGWSEGWLERSDSKAFTAF